MLEYEVLHIISPVQSFVVFLYEFEFDLGLFFGVVFSELEVGEEKLSVLIVLNLKLISLLVVALEEVDLSIWKLKLISVKAVYLLVLFVLVGGEGGDGGGIC